MLPHDSSSLISYTGILEKKKKCQESNLFSQNFWQKRWRSGADEVMLKFSSGFELFAIKKAPKRCVCERVSCKSRKFLDRQLWEDSIDRDEGRPLVLAI